MMTRFFSITILISLFCFNLEAQITPPDKVDISNMNPEDVTPALLKDMGLTDSQIDIVMQKIANGEQLPSDLTKLENYEDYLEPDTLKERNQVQEVQESVFVAQPVVKEGGIVKVYGQGFFRNSNIKLYQRASEIRAPDNYILGVGDEINIVIWGTANYSQVYTLDNNGAIHPKLLGRMYLKGLSLEKARSLLKRRFGSIFDLSSSQIDITLTYSRVITTNIVGEVERPGSYTISAVNTAFNALMASGGVSDIGSVREIYVKRKGKIVRKLDVYEFLMDPKGDYDFFLENDDYIFIPVIGRTVTVVGEVKREHTYELIEEEHLTKLIDFAGGLTSAAYTTNIQIKRYLDSEEILIDLSLDSLTRNNLDFELQDGDHVIIHKIPEGITNYVEIIGAVKLPGKYQLKEGQKISDVINIAEGILYNTYLPRGYVVRINEDLSIQYIPFNLGSVMSNMNSGENIRLQSFDLINIYAKDDFKDDFNISIEGAVRIPGVYPFGNGLKLKDVLYFGGGLKHGAANNRIEISRILNFNDAVNQALPTRITVLTVQVDFNLNIDDDAAAFELQPFDQIFVRTTPEFEFQRNVTISGEILYAGTYSLLSKEERLSDVIARAGGVTDWAFLEGATLFRVDNEAGYLFMDVKKVLTHQNTKTNYILKEGDIIVIPKINELIMIAGEIEYPGTDVINAPYHKNRCARFYIRKYGAGFTKDAKKRKTYVVLPGGFVKNTTGFGLFNIYPRVKKGSTIVVVKKVKREKEDKEKVEIDWNVFIEKTTVKITGLLTLYFLITNL